MRPAGHTSTGVKEKEYEEIDDKLAKIFTEYLNNADNYEYAEQLLHDYGTIPLSHTHQLILQNSNHPNLTNLCELIATIYNEHTQEDTIEYDLTTPNLDIGDHLPKEKTLINQGTTHYLGYLATGLTINNGTTRNLGNSATGLTINNGTTHHLGYFARGLIINNGTTHYLGYLATGTIINQGTTKILGWKATGTLINEQEPDENFNGAWHTPTPALIKYLGTLKQHPEQTPSQEELLAEIKQLVPELQ